MLPTFNRLLLLSGACTAALTAAPAFAQADATPGETQLGEIVVTAQRREENLQDVPVSVTALTNEALERKQVVDVISLGKVAPSLQAKQTFNTLEITVAIRGITQLIPSINTDPAIGMYLDGVYNGLPAGSNVAMVDIERAEVLRGPQGTLFGRNTIGGAINVTTIKPGAEFGGYAEAEVGNHGAWSATGAVNLPIVADSVAARIAYQHREIDGYGTNILTGNETGRLNSDYVRASVSFDFSPDWNLLLTGDHTEANSSSAPTKLVFWDPASPTNALFPFLFGRPGDLMTNYIGSTSFQDANTSIDNTAKLKATSFTGALSGRFSDAVSIKSISAYRKTRYNSSQDIDGTPFALIDLLNFPIHSKQWSQEVQLLGDALDSKLQWIAGAYYYHNEGSQRSQIPPTDRGPDGTDNDSYSAFAQATYAIMPSLRVTGGVRYVEDKRRITYHDQAAVFLPNGTPSAFSACLLALPPGANPLSEAACTFTDSVRYNYVPWTVGLDYKAGDDILIYGKISRGYRSGAYPLFGPAADANPVQQALNLSVFGPVSPEKITTEEIGVKGEWFDRRLRVNAAIFHSAYSNVQIEVNQDAPPGSGLPPISVLTNSGAEKIKGGELEVTALLGDLTVDVGLGYADPKYRKGAFVGEPVTNVSKFSGSLGLTYRIETNAGTVTLGGSYAYRSKVYLFSSKDQPDAAVAALTQKGYGLLDARVSFELADAPVTFAIYGRNLTDKDYFAAGNGFGAALGNFVTNYPGPPRTFGASIKYSF